MLRKKHEGHKSHELKCNTCHAPQVQDVGGKAGSNKTGLCASQTLAIENGPL
jgi:hypothetical protein